MKILVLSDGIPPFVMGGMQKHTLNLCRYLVSSNHQVTLIHCVSSEEPLPEEKKVVSSIFGSENPDNFSSKVFHFPAPGKIPGHYVRASKKYSNTIYQTIKHDLDSFDFIYVQGFVGHAFYQNKTNFSAKIGVNFHGLEMFQKQADFKSKLQSKLLKGLTRNHMKNADFVFSLGGKLTDIIQEEGIDLGKIIDIPNAIDDAWIDDEYEFNPVNNNIKFLFVGRFERRKGVEELSEAINQYLENKGSATFEFVGPIPNEKRIDHDQITYHGKVMDVSKLKSIYRKNDILICPSYAEGMPTVILEAMSQGLAVIATDVGATRLLVNEHTGWLLTDLTSDLILKKIESVENEKKVLIKKKQAARRMVQENFSWLNIIQRTNNFLESVK